LLIGAGRPADKVKAILGGFAAWQRAGLPTEP
jgi:rhodanese-related sulfurtransferase